MLPPPNDVSITSLNPLFLNESPCSFLYEEFKLATLEESYLSVEYL
jgi:hypothetical protein